VRMGGNRIIQEGCHVNVAVWMRNQGRDGTTAVPLTKRRADFRPQYLLTICGYRLRGRGIVTHTARTNETRRPQPAGFFVRKAADVAILRKELCASSRTFAGRERSD
jgi:hypothetical protein